jgi:hypothetical protein
MLSTTIKRTGALYLSALERRAMRKRRPVAPRHRAPVHVHSKWIHVNQTGKLLLLLLLLFPYFYFSSPRFNVSAQRGTHFCSARSGKRFGIDVDRLTLTTTTVPVIAR